MPSSSVLVEAIRASYGAGDPDLAGKLVLLAEIERGDVVNGGDAEPLRVATTEFATKPGDTPASAPFRARLRVPGFQQGILDSDWQHWSGFEVSQIEILNPDARMDAAVDPAVYDIEGREVRLLGGLVGWTYAQLAPLPGGSMRVLDVIRDAESIKVAMVPELSRTDQPVQQVTYGGYGNAVDFADTADDLVGNVYNLGLRDATLSIRFNTSTVSANCVLIDKRGSLTAAAGTPGYVVFINSSGELRVFLDDGSNFAAKTIGTASEFSDDLYHQLDVVISRGTGEMIAYVDGVAQGAATDISALTGRLSNATALHRGSLGGASAFFPGIIDEPRVYLVALTARQVGDRWQHSADGSEAGLVGLWRYDEVVGTALANDVLGPMLVQAHLDGSKVCSMGDTADPGSGSFTLTGWGRVASGAGGAFAGRRAGLTASDVGYGARLSSGDVILEACDGTTLYQVTIAGDYDDDTPWGWYLVVNRDTDELRGGILDFPRGTITPGAPVDITGAGSFGGGTINFKLGAYDDGSAALTGVPSWIGYVEEALSEEAILVGVGAEVSMALSSQWAEINADGLTRPRKVRDWADAAGSHFWPVNAGVGTTVVDHVGAANGTFNSAPTWVTRHGVLTVGASGSRVGTLEGGIDIRGLPKPVAMGRPQRLAPVLIDQARLIYQYSDPRFPTEEVEAVYIGGIPLTLTTDYTVDLSTSTITLVTSHEAEITCSVRGVQHPVDGHWLEYPGELIAFVWEYLRGVTAIDQARIDAYDDLHPFQSEHWLGPCDQSLEQVYTKLLTPDGYAFRTLAGDQALGTRVKPGLATPVLSLDSSGIVVEGVQQVTVPPPTWFARCAYSRTVTPLRSFSSGSLVGEKQDAKQSVRYVEDRRVEVLEQHADALVRTYDTPISKRQDAALLVQRMLDLDEDQAQGWLVPLTKDHWFADIGDEVEILTDEKIRYDLGGKQYLVVDHVYGMEDGSAVSALILWG